MQFESGLALFEIKLSNKETEYILLENEGFSVAFASD